MYTAIIVFSSCRIFGVCKKGAGDSKSPRSPTPFPIFTWIHHWVKSSSKWLYEHKNILQSNQTIKSWKLNNQANFIKTSVCYLHHSSVSILKVATESRDIKLTNKKSNSNTTEHMLQIYCTLTFSTL